MSVNNQCSACGTTRHDITYKKHPFNKQAVLCFACLNKAYIAFQESLIPEKSKPQHIYTCCSCNKELTERPLTFCDMCDNSVCDDCIKNSPTLDDETLCPSCYVKGEKYFEEYDIVWHRIKDLTEEVQQIKDDLDEIFEEWLKECKQ